MNLYLLKQYKNAGYNTYDSCVVVSESEEKAKLIYPHHITEYNKEFYDWKRTWAMPEFVIVTCIGKADPSLKEGEVLCASFNAG